MAGKVTSDFVQFSEINYKGATTIDSIHFSKVTYTGTTTSGHHQITMGNWHGEILLLMTRLCRNLSRTPTRRKR